MAKKDTVSIEKINIKIGKEEISLTPEAAVELKDLLNELFEKEKTVYIPGSPITIPYPYPVYPRPYRYWDRWYTWGDTSGVSYGTTTNDDTTGSVTYSLAAG